MVGERFTTRNRLSQMLQAQESAAAPVTSHTQGLAQMLRAGLQGYMQGADRRDRSAAMAAMNAGLTAPQGSSAAPIPQGGMGPMPMVQQSPYAAAGANLSALGDNEYAQDMMQRMTMQDIGWKQQQGAQDDALNQFEEQMKIKQQYAAPTTPKTIKTAEGVFLQNPDGTLGQRLGGAKAETEIIMGGELSKDYRPVYDETGKQIGAEPVPGGKEDVGTIQKKKEAERKAALNIENLEKLPARRSQIFASVQNAPAFQGAVKDAKELAKGWSTSGLAQQALGNIAGTDAFALERSLDTIKSNIGFGELLRIKEAGGTLGALSEMENRLLQAMQGALDPRLKGNKLVTALERVEQIQKLNLEQKKREFKDMYPNSERPWETQATGSNIPQGQSDEDLLNKYGGM